MSTRDEGPLQHPIEINVDKPRWNKVLNVAVIVVFGLVFAAMNGWLPGQ